MINAGMDSRVEMEKSMLSPEAQQEFDDLVAVLVEKYGPSGPPKDTTFAEIDLFGHQAGRVLGRAVDEHLTARHAEHFQETPCPACGVLGKSKETHKTRPLQTIDGEIPLAEAAFHCPTCDWDFPPSADRTCD